MVLKIFFCYLCPTILCVTVFPYRWACVCVCARAPARARACVCACVMCIQPWCSRAWNTLDVGLYDEQRKWYVIETNLRRFHTMAATTLKSLIVDCSRSMKRPETRHLISLYQMASALHRTIMWACTSWHREYENEIKRTNRYTLVQGLGL